MSSVFIIAEIGVNHNGDIELAKRMIDAAANAKVDAVKFQSFHAKLLVTQQANKAEYQIKNSGKTGTQYDMLKKLELNEEEHKCLMRYCEEKNILFLSSAFDLESIEMLDKLGLKIFKIPSGEITNYPYLKKIASLKRRVILSTGMSTIQEIQDAIEVLKKNGTTDIVLLQCNTEYPTPMEDVNLRSMVTLQNKFGLCVGYSDHSLGIEVPIAAVAMGAQVIEKHFTLDKTMQGPDHKASLEPHELADMVRKIRNIEKALGSIEKIVSTSENKNKEIARKSIVAARKINKGEVYTEENLTTKRPGNGISPMRWEELIGKTANKDYKEDELIIW